MVEVTEELDRLMEFSAHPKPQEKMNAGFAREKTASGMRTHLSENIVSDEVI